ncbi:MAG: DNA polymerase II [Proteobacteria bacterium]|nr:DNA polymerase II [Pseudomonadota bacterium]
MSARGFILQPGYRVRDGAPQIELYGRLEDGRPFVVEDDRFRPYFFVRSADAAALAGERGVEIAEADLTTWTGESVVRVTTPTPGDLVAVRDRLRGRGLRCFESDVRFAYRYLIDRNLRSLVEIEGPEATQPSGLVRFHNPELGAASFRPHLRLLSLDIETTPDASRVLSIALVGEGVDEVHMVSSEPVDGAAVYADEPQLLAAAATRLRQIDPDVLTGWHVVDFDLRVLAERAERCRTPFAIGRSEGPIRLVRDQRFLRQSRAEVRGRMVVDALPLVRDARRLPDYRLDTVAQSVLGRGKLIASDGEDHAQEILRQYREDPAGFVAYNREDARLVLEILDHEGLFDLCVERSLLSGMQLDRVGASVASFDLLYLPRLRQRGFVAPDVAAERKLGELGGGAVLASEPGLYRNVAVFDFKSLYPSLVRTFSLDPVAFHQGGEDVIEAPNGARFARRGALLPEIVEEFQARREAAKGRGDRHADQAIKIMMNALYGVLGSAGCRFFEPDVANAITGFGQQTLLWTREAFESAGHRVLYGDTDSVFVALDPELDAEAARALAEALRERVRREIDRRVARDYRVESRLELELERVYERFFLPRVRGGKTGSKKRYAGSLAGELHVVGLESVRRDWPPLAGRLQRGLLERLFRDQELLPFAREIVRHVQESGVGEEFVYAKRIRKGSLDRYTATTPPHVQAARKVGADPGPVIRYVVTETGPEPVREGQPLPGPIDRQHYRERVVRPIADAILGVAGLDLDDALGVPKQLPLLDDD